MIEQICAVLAAPAKKDTPKSRLDRKEMAGPRRKRRCFQGDKVEFRNCAGFRNWDSTTFVNDEGTRWGQGRVGVGGSGGDQLQNTSFRMSVAESDFPVSESQFQNTSCRI